MFTFDFLHITIYNLISIYVFDSCLRSSSHFSPKSRAQNDPICFSNRSSVFVSISFEYVAQSNPRFLIVAAHHTMLYKVICAATIGIASISVLTQLILLPWLHQHTENLKAEFESRLRKFHHNARQFDEQLHRLGKLTGAGVSPLLRADASADENGNVAKMKRQIPDCPPPRVGSPGPIGEPGEDGESGDAGEDGAAGLDAMTLLMQEAQKCVICPQGPAGPIGAPGQQGFNGPTGEKGEMGEAGTDGLDGEQGPEGLPGLPGISGKAGKKGPPGSSAPGGTGPPGSPGVKGPIGPTGKQGERGRRNFVIGMPGQDGRSGKQGLDGLEGKPGGRGDKGPTGEDGADARFCPCPSELNKLGNGGEKPHSHLMPPPGGLPTAPTNPTKALPPAPAQAPSSKSADDEERKPPLEEGTQIGGGPAVPVKQPTSAAIPNNASIEAATNLRIAPIRPGEQPTTGKEAAAQMNNYEDAYPNYESGGSEDGLKGGGGKGRGKSGEEAPKPQYDDEIQLNGAEKGGHDGQQQQEEVKPAISENGGEEEDEDNQQQEAGAAPMATRRFVYVTKRPRPKL